MSISASRALAFSTCLISVLRSEVCSSTANGHSSCNSFPSAAASPYRQALYRTPFQAKRHTAVGVVSPALFKIKKAATVSDSRRVSYTTLLSVVLFLSADNRCADGSAAADKQQGKP